MNTKRNANPENNTIFTYNTHTIHIKYYTDKGEKTTT